HHQVRITDFTADSPQIQLIQGENGVWNYASLGRGGSAGGSQQGSTGLSIGELKISDGSVSVSSLPETGKPLVYSNVNLTARHLSMTTPVPFDLTASLPGNGTLKLTGTAGPVAAGDAVRTPVKATLVL